MKTNLNLFSDSQLTLFDLPAAPVILDNHAAARNLYGSFCEQIAVEALKLRRLKISGSFDACYDAQGENEHLYEIKSVKHNGAVPIWSWRMAKDVQVVKEGHKISYVFVTHDCSGMVSSHELWGGLSATVRQIFVLPVETVKTLHEAGPVGGIKLGLGGSGYDRLGYRDGYRRVSVKAIRETCNQSWSRQFSVSGHSFSVAINFPQIVFTR